VKGGNVLENSTRDALWIANYEEGVRPSLKYPEIPVHYILARAARRFPQRNATNFLGATLSYRDLFAQVNKMAAALAGLGVKKGERVGIILPNSPQALISYFAILQIGAIAVLINPLSAEMELVHIINDAGVENLILIDSVYRRISNIKDRTKIKNLVVTGLHDYLNFPANLFFSLRKRSKGTAANIYYRDGIYRFTQLIRNAPDSPPAVEIDPRKDVAILQYTGGVTGTLKGAMLTHFNLVANTVQFREWFSSLRDGEERFLGVLPVMQIYGISVVNLGVFTGSMLILLTRFEVDRVLKTINKTRPSFFPGVPTMFAAINNYPDVRKYNISSIDYVNSGGAPLPPEVWEKFEKLTGARLMEGYGLVESSPVAISNPAKGRRKMGSIGLPISDTQAKIVSLEEPERELGVGEIGELAISGPQVMKGYWNNLEETNLVLRDGWLYTGDIAEMDRDGYFYIINRKKDMIIMGGYNVFPREVEEVLRRHPKVMEAVVMGIPDDYYGEVVKAYIFPREGRVILEDELRDYCLNKLASYKIPRQFEIRREHPAKDLSGPSLRRYLLREGDGKKIS
jgi:long-chain acyl-CoA synthetase